MTIRQYWVHDDEPLHLPTTQTPPTQPTQPPEPPPNWESLLNSLLQLIQPHPALYRSALFLLSGRPAPPLPPNAILET